jgi:hypothetical protein
MGSTPGGSEFQIGVKKSPHLPPRQGTKGRSRPALTRVTALRVSVGQGFGGFLGLRERSFLIQCSGVSSPPQAEFFMHLDVPVNWYIVKTMYSLRPKNQVILGFKICPKKQVTLPYLESALLPNMGNK